MKNTIAGSGLLVVLLTCLAHAAAPPPPPEALQPAGVDAHPPAAAKDWKVETLMLHPKINTPSMVCALPDGRVLVAEHWMSNVGGRDPIDRILCVHPDGRITLFADKLWPVFGLAYIDGKVFVHHMPVFSVLVDDNGVGKDRRDILDKTGVLPASGLTDHLPAQIRLAMDGYFYMSVGDRGFYGAKSNVDGKTGALQGGGIVRIRPDGTDLEVYASGTRNHLDVSVNAEDELFTYDNTDDGHGWWTRLTHMVDGGFYGYPWDYKRPENRNDPASARTPTDRDLNTPFQPYTLWRMAEYGGGSPTGAIAYNEDALPDEYRGNLFHLDWGKGKVQRFVVEREGGTYKVAKAEDWLQKVAGGDLRPLGIAVSPDGMSFYVTDWGYGGWMQNKPVGRLLKVTYTGPSQATPKPAWFVPAATNQKFEAPTAELIAALRHPAESVRLVAQRRIAERGTEAVAPLAALMNDAKAPPYARWVAIWTLDRIDGGKAARAAIAELAKGDKDVSVRRQAARQIGTRRAVEGTDALVASLGDADASVRFQAATALGRVGNAAAVPSILARLDEKDLFTRFALFTALNRIGTADPKAWPAIVAGLESGNEAVAANTTYALRNAYQPDLVTALTKLAYDRSKPAAARARALLAGAELFRKPKEWAGEWWQTQPVARPRPPKVVDWSGTTTVLSAIQDLLKDSDPAVRQAAVKATQVAPDPAVAEALVKLFDTEKDVGVRRDILRALVAGKSPKAGPLAAGVLKDAKTDPALLPDALAVIEQTGAGEVGPQIVALIDTAPGRDVLERAIATAGATRLSAAVPAIAKHLRSNEAAVRTAATTALTQINDYASADALVAVLEDRQVEVRRAAMSALGTMRARSAIPALIKASTDAQTRDDATAALCRMPTVDALDLYLQALAGPNTALRNQARAALTSISADARPQIESRVEALNPETLAAVQAIYDLVQPVVQWSLIGPFDAAKADPFAGDKLDQYPGLNASVTVGEKTLRWKTVRTRDEHGMVDLAAQVSPNERVNAFLLGEYRSPDERDVELVIGSDDTQAVWLNGAKVSEDAKDGSWRWDKVRVKAHLKAGRNVILARVGNTSGTYQFSLGISPERKGKLFESAVAAKRPDRTAYEQFAAANAGNAENGGRIFRNVQTVGCIKCHQVSPTEGGVIGPSLLGVGAKYDRAKLIESVLYPSKQIFDGYEQWTVRTQSGDVQAGVIRGETEQEIELYDSAVQKSVIKKSDIASRRKSEQSLMPDGLEQGMTPQELADVIAFLQSLNEKPAGAK